MAMDSRSLESPSRRRRLRCSATKRRLWLSLHPEQVAATPPDRCAAIVEVPRTQYVEKIVPTPEAGQTVQIQQDDVITVREIVDMMAQHSHKLQSLEFTVQMMLEDALLHAEQIGYLQRAGDDMKKEVDAMEKAHEKIAAVQSVVQSEAAAGIDAMARCEYAGTTEGIKLATPNGARRKVNDEERRVDAAFDRWLATTRLRGKGRGRGKGAS